MDFVILPDRVLKNRLLCNACEFGQTSFPYSNCFLIFWSTFWLRCLRSSLGNLSDAQSYYLLLGTQGTFWFYECLFHLQALALVLGVDRRSSLTCRASGMAGRIMHGTLLLIFWRDPSMVVTYYSSQLRIQSGYSRQQPSTYLEKRRYFTGPGRKVTFSPLCFFYEIS